MKRTITRIFPLASLLLVSGLMQGQINQGGEPVAFRAHKAALPTATIEYMASFDVETMKAEDAFNDENKIGPWRFGKNFETNFDLNNSGVWHTFPNGDKLWQLSIRSEGALSINFEFNEYEIPDGAKIFVYGEGKSEFIGSFTNKNNEGHGELGVQPVLGEQITIEYFVPAQAAFRGRLMIGQVTHAYRDIMGYAKGLGDSGSCNNNVNCPEGLPWDAQIRSVAIIIVGGSGACTGTLLNNCNDDGSPYFLTANHCLGGSNTWIFRFNWNSPDCTPTTNGPTNQTVSGSTLLASSGGSDFGLLEMNSTPPGSYGVFYSGWDNSGNTPSNLIAIHHPSGDVKKISFDDDSPGQATWGGAQTWHIFAWEDGTTEPGSSGSGLWSDAGLLIGQLYGGQASCGNNVNDYYGRFDVSYPQISQWLGSCGSTLEGYDPNIGSLPLDAGILSIEDVPANLCNETDVTPSAVLKNYGSTTLTSANINWEINSGGNNIIPWTGSLTTGQTATVQLPTMNGSSGMNTIDVSVSDPNGGTDGNPVNDAKDANFMATDPGAAIFVEITTDDWGSETTWDVVDDNNNTLFTGGPYTDVTGGTLESTELCLGVGCYDFTIYDAYGDGICCGFGDGSYEIVDQWGTQYVMGDGQFTDDMTHNFCITNVGIDESENTLFSVFPNPTEGVLNIVFANDMNTPVEINIYDAIGALVMSEKVNAFGQTHIVDLNDVTPGLYMVEVYNGTQRTLERIVLER